MATKRLYLMKMASNWRSLKHNGQFVTNLQRVALIHARNEMEAKSKIKLTEAKTQQLSNLLIETSNEFIYSVTKIGTVTIEKFYVYSGDRSPILVRHFKMRESK